MEALNRLVVLTFSQADWVRQVEGAVQFGRPLLMKDVGEELDPLLEHLLGKAYIRCVCGGEAGPGEGVAGVGNCGSLRFPLHFRFVDDDDFLIF